MNTESTSDRILESINGIQQATAPDFFYAGIMAKRARNHQSVTTTPFFLKPVFVTISLCLLLFINWITIHQSVDMGNKVEQTSSGEQNFAMEYHLITETVAD